MRIIYALLALFVATNSYAQTCPTNPPRVAEVVTLLYTANVPLAQGTDDDRRRLTRLMAEQLRFEFGGWSTKASSPNNPPSKDSLAYTVPGGFCNIDWQDGGSRKPFNPFPQHGEFIGDQFLIPTAAVNHLGTVAPPIPPVVPPVSAESFAALVGRVERLDSEMGTVAVAADQLRQAVSDLFGIITALRTQAAASEAAVQRIDGYLASRPIPAECSVSVFGIGLGCELR